MPSHHVPLHRAGDLPPFCQNSWRAWETLPIIRVIPIVAIELRRCAQGETSPWLLRESCKNSPPNVVAGRLLRHCGGHVALLSALLLTGAADGQYVPAPQHGSSDPGAAAAPPDGTLTYRAFPLQHLDADTARKRLGEMLAAAPGLEVVVDGQRNRVLVRGNPPTHQLVAQVLSNIDRPKSAEAAGTQGSVRFERTKNLGLSAERHNTRHFYGLATAIGWAAGRACGDRRADIASAGVCSASPAYSDPSATRASGSAGASKRS